MQNPMFDKEWYEKQAKLQFKHEQSISISTLMPSLSKLVSHGGKPRNFS